MASHGDSRGIAEEEAGLVADGERRRDGWSFDRFEATGEDGGGGVGRGRGGVPGKQSRDKLE